MSNAVITVTYNDQSISFELEGAELSAVGQRDGSIHRYLTNASSDFITSEVEKALITLSTGVEL